MMGRLIAVSVAVAAALVAFIVLRGHGEATAIESRVEQHRDTAGSNMAPRPTRGVAAPSLGALDVATAKLSTPERRDGEKATDYEARIVSLRRYERFRSRANLTADQEVKLIRLMGDAQETMRHYRAAMVHTSKKPRPNKLEDQMAYHREFLGQAREFLTEEQLALLNHHIPLIDGWTLSQPIDLD